MTSKLLEVSVQLEQSLSKIPYEDLDISDEVREQVSTTITENRIFSGHVHILMAFFFSFFFAG